MRMFSECDTNAIIIKFILCYVMRMFSECDTNAIIIKFILCYENVLWMWY